MNSKSALTIGGVLVLALGLGGAALAHGPEGKGMRGDRGAAMFQQFDTDGDGAITKAEIDAAAAARFAEADADKDGKLSAEELAARGPAQMFDRLDADKDGTLTAEELADARGKRGGWGGHGKGHGHGERRND